MAFSNGGDALASASYDGSVKVWDVQTLTAVSTMPTNEEALLCVTFSDDGKYLAAAGYDERVSVWENWQNAQPRLRFELKGHCDGITSVLMLEDNRRVITASDDGTLRVWDLVKEQELLRLTGHISSVETAILSLDQKSVISGGRDGTIRVWRAAAKEEVDTVSDRTSR
jgi:WD40 repeat protein